MAERDTGGADTGEGRAARLFNDFEDIDFVEIAVVLAATWIIIRLARQGLPWIAGHVPSVLRLYLIGSVPFIRHSIAAATPLALSSAPG